MSSLQQKQPFCRRRSSRFASPDGVWVYWNCTGTEDLSQVRDLSVGGLFLATEKPRTEGSKVKMEFLVQEGQIRAEAEVRRAEASNGLGLKFTAISDDDRHRLAALLGRLRSRRSEVEKSATAVVGKYRARLM